MKIKAKSLNNTIWSENIQCIFAKELSEFQYDKKDYIFRINADKIKMLATILKMHKTQFLTLIFQEKTVFCQVGDKNQDIRTLIADDSYNYERSFKELCRIKDIPYNEIFITTFSFLIDLKKLSAISKKFFNDEDNFFVSYDSNKLGKNIDSLRFYFVQKKTESKFIEFLILSDVTFEKNKIEILEEVKDHKVNISSF